MSSKSRKRARLELSPEELTTVNDEMVLQSSYSLWHTKFKKATDDPQTMKRLSSDILFNLTDRLSDTDAKARTLPGLNLVEAKALADSFNEDELREWKAGLQKALQDNDWRDVIAHPKLYVAKTRVEGQPSEVPIERQNAVIEAWKAKYLGTSAQGLLRAIDEINNLPLDRNYAKIIPVVQSSGTGKSKTVDEIAKERVLFPLCLREYIGKNYFAYPPVDIAARNHLLRAPPAAEEPRCTSYLRAFLVSLFTQALIQARAFIQAQAFIGNSKPTYAALAMMFYDLFSDASEREDFYEEVVENAAVSVDPTTLHLTLRSLKDVLLQCQSLPLGGCLLHIGMDEVHLLFEQRAQDVFASNHTIFSRLKSVFCEVVAEPLCVVLLSTALTVCELAPEQGVAPSMRERDNERILPAPFTELPFDVDISSEPLMPGEGKLTSVGSISFVARFGRPMFFASYKSHKSQGGHDDVIAMNMRMIVMEKLCGFRWPPRNPAVPDSSSFAVLSARLLLDISPAFPEARKYEEDQVRSHLRLLYSVQRERDVIVTGSSSEPLIAGASAEIMNYHMENRTAYMDIWELLGSFIDKGVIARGTIGRLIGRVLSILAMDRAIDSLPRRDQLKYQAPVTVAAYYKALLTDEAWESLRLSVPANASMLTPSAAGMTFEHAFRSAYIHFSHYAKASDDTPLMDQYSWALWLRGTAILCHLDQGVTDRAIPIHFSDVGGVAPNSMSVILDRDNTGQSVDAAFINIQSAESLGVFSSKDGSPYIDGVHCYALTEEQGITVQSEEPPFDSPDPPPESNLEAPRYRFEISGLASYRQITTRDAGIILAMIDGTKNALFTKHPRKDTLPLLRKIQPMLNGTPDATAWFGGYNEDADTA